MLFAYGQKEPIEVIGTFVSEIVCGANGKTCVDEFTVVKGPGRSPLGKSTAEKLEVLRVGPRKEEICSLMTEGNGADIREKYRGWEAEGFPAEASCKRLCHTCRTTGTEATIWTEKQGSREVGRVFSQGHHRRGVTQTY